MLDHVYQQAFADRSRAPRSLDELRPYVAEYGDADKILTSPRDGQPYVIIWGMEKSRIRRGQMPIVAYERIASERQQII